MSNEQEQIVESVQTPWETTGTVDYDKLVDRFGAQLIDENLIQRIEKITGKPAHPWLKRGLFYSHRDLNRILDAREKGKNFYLYTGRGPSSNSLHVGHLVPFMFTKYLQDAFQVPLVIQLTEDEKYLCSKKSLTLEDAHQLAYENAKDIIAAGFDPQRTFIFTDLDYMDKLYPMALQIERCVTMNQVRGIFGFTDDTNIGMVAYPSIQAAPSFSECFPFIFQEKNVHCLVPCAIDQDPFFRMTRDVAPRLGKKGLNKPAVIHSRFLPLFTGPKMSSSGNPEETIFVTDTPTDIATKIKKYMLTSRNSDEEHSQSGGDCETDVVFQYLKFFEFDEEKLENIRVDYSSGCLSREGIKDYLVEVIQKLVYTFLLTDSHLISRK